MHSVSACTDPELSPRVCMYCKAELPDCNLNGIMGRKRKGAQTLHMQPRCRVATERQKRLDRTYIEIGDLRGAMFSLWRWLHLSV
jgi:hypothetical protein